MKQNFTYFYKLFLVISDIAAILLAFTGAFILRVSFSERPVYTPVSPYLYIAFIASLIPLSLGFAAILGLYTRSIYERQAKESSRLILLASFSICVVIVFDFFASEVIFPAKLVPIYAFIVCCLMLLFTRYFMRAIRLWLYRHNIGVIRTVIIGNNQTTTVLSKFLSDNLESGYKLIGIVSDKKYIPEELKSLFNTSAASAIKKLEPHCIIQTDDDDKSAIYALCVNNHLAYQLVSTGDTAMASHSTVELLGTFPVTQVNLTPLIGWGRIVKRLMDIILSSTGMILFSPIFLVVAIVSKILEIDSPLFFKQERLTRFGKKFYIYKFRSMKKEYSGKDPVKVFEKMGREDLIHEFLENRSKVEKDPRIGPFGRFLRRTSLDELPQLYNILRGDISLIGPRAIPAIELKGHQDVAPIVLSVKSGLTGFAQTAGRSNITMQERLDLDVYYVQNWSILLDLQIILRTIFMVITGRGAK